MVLIVYNGELLNLVLLQNLCSVGKISLLMGSDEIFFRHHLVYEAVHMTLETQVTVGNDTHEMVLAIHNGDTTDMVFCHHPEGITHGLAAADRHRIIDHTILGTLDDSHLARLLIDRHILMYDTDTTFTGDSDSHRRLGDSIHSSCHEGDVKLDVP